MAYTNDNFFEWERTLRPVTFKGQSVLVDADGQVVRPIEGEENQYEILAPAGTLPAQAPEVRERGTRGRGEIFLAARGPRS